MRNRGDRSPTLGELLREPSWLWVACARFPHCLHHAPMALVPLVIRFGAAEPSDTVRRIARCTRCGHRCERSDAIQGRDARLWIASSLRSSR